MNEFTLISSILRRAWLIDPAWADANLALIANIIKGKQANFGNAERRSDEQRIAVLSPEAATLFAPSYYSGFANAPEGSLAYIDLIGPVMKYGFCSDGSYEMTQQVLEAKASPNIRGLFINADTPGGQVDGTASFGDAIKNFGKPTLTFINDGMMASAGTWIGTSANEVYASQKLDSVGSIGVYTTIYDQRERLKQMGIKSIDRYAPQSTEKNKAYKDALKGDFGMVDQELFAICEQFISTITDNRGDRMKGDPSEWNKGQLGFADWAEDIGLIDGICSFSDAVSRLDELCNGAPSKAAAPKSTKKVSTPHFNNMKFQNVSALANVEKPTDEQIDKANADLTTENVTSVTLVHESFIQEAADVSDELEKTKASLVTSEEKRTKLKGKLEAANTKITEQDDKIEELEEKVEAFGKNAGAVHQVTDSKDHKPDGPEIATSIMDNLAHNRTADAMLGKNHGVKKPDAAK